MRLFEGTQWDVPPTCKKCNKLEAECVCPPVKPTPIEPSKQTARIGVEKRKKGKVATVVRDLNNELGQLKELLTVLKDHCGAGGTVKDNNIEIQGDHVKKLQTKLSELGYKIKK